MKMTFTQKLSMIIAVLVIVAITIAWSGLSGASSLNDSITNLTQKEAKKLTEIGIVARYSESCRKNEKNIVLSKNTDEIAAYANIMKTERQEMDKLLISIKELIVKEENRALMQTLQSDLKKYDEFITEIKALSITSLGEGEEAIAAQKKSVELSATKGLEYGEAVSSSVTTILKSNQDLLNEIDAQTTKDYENLRNTNIAIAVGGIALALIIAIFMVRQMMALISSSVTNVSENAEQVASASNQISSSSQQLAEGAQEQAASVEEITSSLTEMKATIEQNSENAREADMLGKDANEAAKMGYEHIRELSTSMVEINDSSRKISNIIKTIDEIAFQTNLLALNAAVEAARAGEHGLGFAVVAEEVRNLAQRSATAAKDTAAIIEKSIDDVRKGNQITEQTNKAFVEILDKVKKTGDIVGEIAIASKEQATGINQLSEAMSQVDSITQVIASNSEESAAASEEMSAQATSMKVTIGELAGIFGIVASSAHSVKSVIHHQQKTAFQSNTKQNKKNTLVVATKKPSEVLPLDDDDLREF